MNFKIVTFLLSFLSLQIQAEGFKPTRLYINAQIGNSLNLGSTGTLENSVERYNTPTYISSTPNITNDLITNYVLKKKIEEDLKLSNQTYSFGYGTETRSNVQANRMGAAVGLRYHFNDNYFIETEIESISMNYFLPPNLPGTSYQNSGTYQDTNGKIGIGIVFLNAEDSHENRNPVGNSVNTIGNPKPKENSSMLGESQFMEKNDLKFITQNADRVVEKLVFNGKEIFELPSSEFSDSGRRKLQIVADRIKNLSNRSYVVITTNTTPYIDNKPGKFENHDLGLLRANLILNYLEQLGINSNQMIPSSYGSTFYEEDPLEKIIIEVRLAN